MLILSVRGIYKQRIFAWVLPDCMRFLYSIQSLLNLEYLDVTERVSVFGEDLCALHDLLYKAVPKLKFCCLGFKRMVLHVTLWGDTKCESIQKLLGSLSCPLSHNNHTLSKDFKASYVYET